jgi:hypothetical protein
MRFRLVDFRYAGYNTSGFELQTVPPVKAVKGNPAGSLDQLSFANERTGFAVVGEHVRALRNDQWRPLLASRRHNAKQALVQPHRHLRRALCDN